MSRPFEVLSLILGFALVLNGRVIAQEFSRDWVAGQKVLRESGVYPEAFDKLAKQELARAPFLKRQLTNLAPFSAGGDVPIYYLSLQSFADEMGIPYQSSIKVIEDRFGEPDHTSVGDELDASKILLHPKDANGNPTISQYRVHKYGPFELISQLDSETVIALGAPLSLWKSGGYLVDPPSGQTVATRQPSINPNAPRLTDPIDFGTEDPLEAFHAAQAATDSAQQRTELQADVGSTTKEHSLPADHPLAEVLAAQTATASDQPLTALEEYVGPMPKEFPLPAAMTFAMAVAIDPVTGHVAYYYNFESPEDLFKAQDAMRSPRYTTVVNLDDDMQQEITGGTSQVRVIEDGIPTEAFKLAFYPRFNGSGFQAVVESKAGFSMLRNGELAADSFPEIKPWTYVKRTGPLGLIGTHTLGKDGAWQLLFDGKLGPKFHTIQAVDYNTEHLDIYLAIEGPDKMVYVINGEKQKVYEVAAGLITSPDGKHYAYATMTDGPEGEQWQIVLDGKEQPSYEALGKDSLHFSPDSQRFAYTAFRDEEWYAVVDGQEQEDCNFIPGKELAFSSDSKHVGYLDGDNVFWRSVVDGRKTTGRPAKSAEQFAFGPDGKAYYIGLQHNGSACCIGYDGTEELEFDKIRALTFPQAGADFAYIGTKKTGDRSSDQVVFNGKPGKEYERVQYLQFTPAGKLIYVANQDDKHFLVSDGMEGSKYDTVRELRVSPDGTHLAMRVKKEDRDLIVLDGQEIASYPYDGIFFAECDASLVFSPEQNHLAYFAQREGKKFLVVDGRIGRKYDQIVIGAPTFTAPSRIRYFGVRDEGLFRVESEVSAIGEDSADLQFAPEKLADWYQLGLEHEEQDPFVAAAYFRKAAELGHAESQCDLGKLYYQDHLADKDFQVKAFDWLSKSAEQGYDRACSNLGILYHDKSNSKADQAEALRWFQIAADKGFPTAQYRLGVAYQDGIGIIKDEVKAVQLLRSAAEQGHMDAQALLGWSYHQGVGVSRDYREAMKWYKLAADQGSVAGMYNVGLLIEFGRGVQRNIPVAKDWYRLAARKGYARAA